MSSSALLSVEILAFLDFVTYIYRDHGVWYDDTGIVVYVMRLVLHDKWLYPVLPVWYELGVSPTRDMFLNNVLGWCVHIIVDFFSIAVSGLLRSFWCPYTWTLIGVNTDLYQWELIMEIRSICLFEHLIYSGSIPTLLRTGILSQGVIIFGCMLLGNIRLDMKEEIPSCPPISLLYALWSLCLLGRTPPPWIYFSPSGDIFFYAHVTNLFIYVEVLVTNYHWCYLTKTMFQGWSISRRFKMFI